MRSEGGDGAKGLRLYDTLTREVREVSPSDGKRVRFYCCGPTVYGPAHIGNFRTFVIQDLFRRVVEALGIKTRHVRNITDVDDKTIRGSMEEGVTLAEFTARWREKFHADCEKLNLLRPHVEPGAVEHIPEQIALIERLIEKGHAYQASDGSVYFRITSFVGYGKLSRLAERELQAGAARQSESAVEFRDEYERESVADFALWKARRPEDGPNFWVSPWGEGRPGWHIECSAMAGKYLGSGFDVHGGGMDLIFPHHENEIAQSEAATCECFARHWFHVAHLMVEGRKMSKSLGNLYTVEDIERCGFTAEELRYVLLSGQYRQPLNFTWDSLVAARSALQRLAEFRDLLPAVGEGGGKGSGGRLEFGEFSPVFEALLDDLNTPAALGALFRIVRELMKGGMSEERAERVRVGFENLLWTFGFRLPSVGGVGVDEPPAEVVEIARERWEAKKRKDWTAADGLRRRLAELGWAVRDGPEGYTLLRQPAGGGGKKMNLQGE